MTAIAEALDRAATAADVDPPARRITIKGAPFTFRTFAGGVFGAGRDASMRDGDRTPDRLVTVTLPAIDGEEHKMVPTIEVVL